jgi:hypothetical protein
MLAWPTGFRPWGHINGVPIYYGQPWVEIDGARVVLSWQ